MTYNQLNDYNFELPEQLIAQYPLPERSASRLLIVDADQNKILHQRFTDLISWLKAGDLVILNDTQVIPARLWGQKSSGGRIECLVERILSEHEVLAHLRFSKPPRPGHKIYFADNQCCAWVVERLDTLFKLYFEGEQTVLEILDQYGQIPLPGYITRSCQDLDKNRYQTIYARHKGAVAAPTAGLHFDQKTLESLNEKGIETCFVTLHVGAGTFQPVRVTSLDQHIMHKEYMHLSPETCTAIQNCRQRGGRVFAVGTTVVRCLETVANSGELRSFSGETQLFIRPGFEFKCVDGLLTNFHLPKSTLLMLVSAFGGYDLVMEAYQQAIQHQYRFFSYGDAMLLIKNKPC